MELSLEKVKAFLESNKEQSEVMDYIKGLSQVTPQTVESLITPEIVESFLEKEEGKKLLQPKLDSYFNKGLSTWQNNNLDKLVAEKMKELNPEQTPEQIELAQIKQQLAQIENEKTREVLKNKALTVATEKDIPTSVIDLLIGQDEDSTISNLSTFEEAMKSYVDAQVKSRMYESSYTPPSGDSTKKTTFTLEEIKNLSEKEITENWDAVQETLSQNK